MSIFLMIIIPKIYPMSNFFLATLSYIILLYIVICLTYHSIILLYIVVENIIATTKIRKNYSAIQSLVAINIWEAIQKRSHEPIYKSHIKI